MIMEKIAGFGLPPSFHCDVTRPMPYPGNQKTHNEDDIHDIKGPYHWCYQPQSSSGSRPMLPEFNMAARVSFRLSDILFAEAQAD